MLNTLSFGIRNAYTWIISRTTTELKYKYLGCLVSVPTNPQIMKVGFVALLSATLASLAGALPLLEKRASVLGIDVSAFQPSINWNTVKANGVQFVYIKATEGTSALSLKFIF